tara:strand:+ start:2650 stop:4041 length:1392 start_codon:yes stop_codon:yes gene_type:complete
MNTAPRYLTSQDAETFLETHKDLEVIEVLQPDMNGILRGKWITPAGLAKLCAGQVKLPQTTLALDVWGNDIDKLVFDKGDPDGYCHPVAGSLVRVPWSQTPAAQVLTTMHDARGAVLPYDPQGVLQRQLERLAALGLTPVVAAELEFYLLDRTPGSSAVPPSAHAGPQTPSGLIGAQTYGIDVLSHYTDVLNDMRIACEGQGLPVDTIVKEASPGQFEINLHHQPDVRRAADQAIMMKRAIKTMARRHDLLASFMAKPFMELSGNGFHVHISLLDQDGRNIFDNGGEDGSPALRHAVAGLAASMADFMAVFAPNINSYRRFQPGAHAPITPDWGYDNRTTALRIPSGAPASRRIEHRLAGADANPYLVLAAILAGVHHGLSRKLKAAPPVDGNAYATKDHDGSAMTLPDTWVRAFERFGGSSLVRDYFGEDFVTWYLLTKEQELARLGRTVTSLEYDSYLAIF